MKKIFLFTVSVFAFSGCVNKHGVSIKYYSDCNEYYDLQGYYHKECNDDIVTYKEVKKKVKKLFEEEQKKEQNLIEGEPTSF